ncbi:4'-phosphopantetheinyl transferase superfamily protein [Campylobacter sp. RM16188]|uniref:4'-phosphopantetheinyl transferase family protein n=1 Tax=Campylobacter sp. RM16188 TaxID=1705725 RepID=UPI001554216F|nr:4'-phosphopantetheinyl transferase superfamily protein [Campylobacter sp. RM16188]
MKDSLELVVCLKKELKFNKKMLSKADKRRVKRYPYLLQSKSFINSRALKFTFKKRSKFCISHKDGCVAVLFGKGGFGIDIEELKDRNFDHISEFCFTEFEQQEWSKSLKSKEKFYQIYTTKEALIKAQNLGFSELKLVDAINSKGYFKKSFIVNDLFIVSVVFKGKKDIMIKFYKDESFD